MNLWVYVSAVCLCGWKLLAFVEGKHVIGKTCFVFMFCHFLLGLFFCADKDWAAD